MPTAPSAASEARATAARVVEQVTYGGRLLDRALETALATPDQRGATTAALVQELAYGTLRWAEPLQYIARQLLERPLRSRDRDLHALLLVGLYQLIHMRVPAHAAVAETVAATAVLGKPWAKALLNACLRSFTRNKEPLLEQVRCDPILASAHPRWLLDALRRSWPDHYRAIVEANNHRPPMSLRVNLRRNSRDEYLACLLDAGLRATPVPRLGSAVVLDTPVPVSALPGFAEGRVSVQDAAAQLAPELLDVHAGEHVLDACAAPGGKLGHILEHCAGTAHIVALDKEPARHRLIHENLARLRLKAAVIVGDAADPGKWWDGVPFDRILVDAPCSGSGVIRRHPDIKLHRSRAVVESLVRLQARILDGLWSLLASGGKLLYVTCSVLPAENDHQVSAFTARHGDAAALTLAVPVGIARAPGIQILPGQEDMDGFYYACLQKT
ncbi:MAG: 16S rRNA (cytosine(967)-C(5))-methyltransferase RsmB [Acidiferrobacterales bacterium]